MRIFLALVVLLAACAGTPPGPAKPGKEAQALDDLTSRTWMQLLSYSPYGAAFLGYSDFAHLNPDLSPEGIAAHQQVQREALAKLEAIPRDKLDPQRQLDYDLFHLMLTDGAGALGVIGVNSFRFHAERMPFDTLFTGPHHFPNVVSRTSFGTKADYERFLQRLSTFDTYADQVVAVARLGLQSGWTHPKPVARLISSQTESVLRKDLSKNPIYAPFTRMPESIAAADREAMQASAQKLMNEEVLPALERYDRFLKTEYVPGVREPVGASNLPDGAAYYAHLVRSQTTTQMTPDEIHSVGLSEVARIHREMDSVMKGAGFDGTRAGYSRKILADKRFIYRTGEESLAAHRAQAKELDPHMTRLFGKLPRTPYGVEPMPEAVGKSGGSPYMQPPTKDGMRGAAFFINTVRPELQPAHSMPSLVAHEAVPGHVLQISLAAENTGLAPFRRDAIYGAFVEGWALYAERLVGELGLYKTPEAKFGNLSLELWRAVRLVVDTGIHAKGWTRQQAIDYCASAAPDWPLARIEAEVDRYIAWPGQALGYKVGELKIREIRARAEKALGPRFDIRAFHDELLGSGALPLSVLERRMDAWVAARQGT